MPLTEDITHEVAGTSLQTFEVNAGATVYAGGYLALIAPGHSGAGKVTPFLDDTNGHIPLGFATHGAAAGEKVKVEVGGRRHNNQAVTGVTAATDAGKFVYCVDDGAFSLTAPITVATHVGKIIRFVSAGVADVEFFPHASMMLEFKAADGAAG